MNDVVGSWPQKSHFLHIKETISNYLAQSMIHPEVRNLSKWLPHLWLFLFEKQSRRVKVSWEAGRRQWQQEWGNGGSWVNRSPLAYPGWFCPNTIRRGFKGSCTPISKDAATGKDWDELWWQWPWSWEMRVLAHVCHLISLTLELLIWFEEVGPGPGYSP